MKTDLQTPQTPQKQPYGWITDGLRHESHNRTHSLRTIMTTNLHKLIHSALRHSIHVFMILLGMWPGLAFQFVVGP